MLLSDGIYSHTSNASYILGYPKFRSLHAAIDEYYDHAFSPEIITALRFIENSELAAELVAKHAGAGISVKAGARQTQSRSEKRFQTNLLSLQKDFEEAISPLKIPQNHILFIDGIDIRPTSIPYDEYLDCVRGLANATWSLNNDFFPRIRDTPGRLRIVMLVRPDIFNSLSLQNRNTKLRDNAVVLDWRTTYEGHRQSPIFFARGSFV